ncbi:NAD(P)H-binding protein [Dinghuibacter silviterrae]|uniref:Nucleoside-diphosphate-sugar epimerase n=1 Tax=Dinghuibacter silviterrae TaxID=1539049 RepID=A0A4R8DUR8_9BACT|nr:NAD(P)H-binding protein [Dinghuibacter silviterrae]TDX02124.1 nucleoside-diphosphate-sugar epimerase [Dinghuibacter silviterrae]
MKMTITGSLGNISKPLTELLVRQGHTVKVISSDPSKKTAIEAIGATAAIGSIGDTGFLARAFTGADAVYAMIPMSFAETDQDGYMRRMADSYVQAIKGTGVPRAVVLSGWAADLLSEGNAEKIFDQLNGVSVCILRPAAFYSNFYMSMDLIRGKGWIGKFLTLRYSGLGALLTGKTGLLMGNYGGDDRTVFVSPKDIADAAAEELLTNTDPKKIRYVGSEEMTCNEAARIIGTAIGKPWLKWVLISDKEMLQGLKMAKMPDKLAASLVEMQTLIHKGIPLQNFHRSQPKWGRVKLADFAKEFAVAYHTPKA